MDILTTFRHDVEELPLYVSATGFAGAEISAEAEIAVGADGEWAVASISLPICKWCQTNQVWLQTTQPLPESDPLYPVVKAAFLRGRRAELISSYAREALEDAGYPLPNENDEHRLTVHETV